MKEFFDKASKWFLHFLDTENWWITLIFVIIVDAAVGGFYRIVNAKNSTNSLIGWGQVVAFVLGVVGSIFAIIPVVGLIICLICEILFLISLVITIFDIVSVCKEKKLTYFVD